MFSEQWKSSLFAGIAVVLIGICYVAVAQSAPLLSIVLARKYTSQTIEWPKADCQVSSIRFSATDSSLHLFDVKFTFAFGRTQEMKNFGALIFKGSASEWRNLHRNVRTGEPECIQSMEVTARSVGSEARPARLQVEVR